MTSIEKMSQFNVVIYMRVWRDDTSGIWSSWEPQTVALGSKPSDTYQ